MATPKETTAKKTPTSEKKVKVQDIPERKKELTEEEVKEVKGGGYDLKKTQNI